jgi:hypothetical protein
VRRRLRGRAYLINWAAGGVNCEAPASRPRSCWRVGRRRWAGRDAGTTEALWIQQLDGTRRWESFGCGARRFGFSLPPGPATRSSLVLRSQGPALAFAQPEPAMTTSSPSKARVQYCRISARSGRDAVEASTLDELPWLVLAPLRLLLGGEASMRCATPIPL